MNNLVGGTVDIQDDGRIGEVVSPTVIDPGTINNAGLFTKTGGTGFTTLVAILNNLGDVEIASGTVSAQRGGTLMDSNFQVDANSALDLIGGVFTMTGANQFSGSGKVLTRASGGAGGRVDIPTGSTATFNLPGDGAELSGTLDVNGSLINLGDALFTGVALSGNGSLINRSKMEIGNNAQIGGTLDNEASITQTGTGNLHFNTDGRLINRPGATYEFQSTAGLAAGASDNTPLFDNRGLLKKTDGSTSFVAVSVATTGDISVEDGGITFRRDGDYQGADLMIATGSQITFESGLHEFSGTSTVTGDGTLAFVGSATVDINSVTSVNLPVGGTSDW